MRCKFTRHAIKPTFHFIAGCWGGGGGGRAFETSNLKFSASILCRLATAVAYCLSHAAWLLHAPLHPLHPPSLPLISLREPASILVGLHVYPDSWICLRLGCAVAS